VLQHGAGARRARDLGLGRRPLAIERIHRRCRALGVAHSHLVHALGQEQIGDRVDQGIELAELCNDPMLVRAARRQLRPAREQRVAEVLPELQQLDAVDDVARGDRFQLHGIVAAGHQRHGCQPAQRQDPFGQRHAALAQPSLEPVAEQRAERLALAHAVEHAHRGGHPQRGQVDRRFMHRKSAHGLR
jgi:hypothetical protein